MTAAPNSYISCFKVELSYIAVDGCYVGLLMKCEELQRRSVHPSRSMLSATVKTHVVARLSESFEGGAAVHRKLHGRRRQEEVPHRPHRP